MCGEVGRLALHAQIHRDHKYMLARIDDFVFNDFVEISVPAVATEKMDHHPGCDVQEGCFACQLSHGKSSCTLVRSLS